MLPFLFSRAGPFGILSDGNGTEEPSLADPAVLLLGWPWVVPCDGDSASLADVMAAVARDRVGYPIGTKRAGALGVARYYEFEDDSAMEITVNRVGVAPHGIVPLAPANLSAGLCPAAPVHGRLSTRPDQMPIPICGTGP